MILGNWQHICNIYPHLRLIILRYLVIIICRLLFFDVIYGDYF